KYKLIIDDFGGWGLFQHLLQALKAVGDRHGVDIATIASAWVLEQPQVAAVIVGARNQAHALANAKIMDVA
ncbi:MAG: aldo/keto reductase, partial [Mesorhizobium sp.]